MTNNFVVEDENKLYDDIIERKAVKPPAPSLIGMLTDYIRQYQSGVDPMNMSVHPSFLAVCCIFAFHYFAGHFRS
jgi:hypothetical protein